MGMFYRTIRMLEHGIKPVYVFDGKPPQLKSAEVSKDFLWPSPICKWKHLYWQLSLILLVSSSSSLRKEGRGEPKLRRCLPRPKKLVKTFLGGGGCWKLLVFKPHLDSDYITSIIGKSVNMFYFGHESLIGCFSLSNQGSKRTLTSSLSVWLKLRSSIMMSVRSSWPWWECLTLRWDFYFYTFLWHQEYLHSYYTVWRHPSHEWFVF